MCGSPTTAAVTDFLTGLFERFGLVEEITTDNGVQLTSTEFNDFLQAHGVRHTRSALYSPEANAEVERFNRVIIYFYLFIYLKVIKGS
jgi:transposase InsO family protein